MKILFPIITAILILIAFNASAFEIIEDFETQTLGDRCTPFWINQFDITVTDIQAASGAKACKFKVTTGGTGWGGGMVIPGQAVGTETWIRFRIFMPAGFDYRTGYDDGLLKFVRIDQEQPGGAQGRFDWLWADPAFQPTTAFWQGVEGVPCTTNCFYKFGGSNNPVEGVWETWEVYAKWSYTSKDSGGEGRALFWKNGVLVGERTDFPTMYTGANSIVGVRFFDHWNGGSRADQELYFDDLVITDTTPTSRDAVGNAFIGLYYPQADPTITEPCTGGSGSDYGGMTCFTPLCNIASDPSLGCVSTGIPGIPGQIQMSRCYLVGDNYLNSYVLLPNQDFYDMTGPDMMAQSQAMCAQNPAGYLNPSATGVPLTNGADSLLCYELTNQFASEYCGNL